MTTARTRDEGAAQPSTPGDNRGAGDLDGNKAGAPTGNKTPGPDEPAPAQSNDTHQKRGDHNNQSTSKE